MTTDSPAQPNPGSRTDEQPDFASSVSPAEPTAPAAAEATPAYAPVEAASQTSSAEGSAPASTSDADAPAREPYTAVQPRPRERERDRGRGRDRDRGGRDRDRDRDRDRSSDSHVTPENAPWLSIENPDIPFDKLDFDAAKVVNRLTQHGYQAYFVGGCVRDSLVGKRPKDFDIATSAHPNDVRNVFRNCRLIGRRFRLAHVYFKGGKIVEVSTFRANPTEVEAVQALANEESDAHEIAAHGELVENAPVPLEAGVEIPPDEPEAEDDLLITHDNVFGTDEQDARRRDFTVNGLFYDLATGKVIDHVRGLRDIQLRRIRTIGDPEIRMREDPVRILRAVRFACKLDFDIESRTYAAMEGAVEDLPRCSAPRLLEETFRLLRGGVAAPSLKLVSALDALRILLPPVAQFLKDNGPEAEKSFYAHAEALDRKVASSDHPLEDAILLAALLLPIARTVPLSAQQDEGPRQSVGHVIEDLLAELVKNARLPRRIAERCRMILLAQKTLSGERRRRSGLASFRRHPLFNESLLVFEIGVEATGEFRAQLEAWNAGGTPTLPTGAPLAQGEAPRRRRRRRRRGPKVEGATPGEPGAEASAGGDEQGAEGDEGPEDSPDSSEPEGQQEQ